jgi:hypothetical protein
VCRADAHKPGRGREMIGFLEGCSRGAEFMLATVLVVSENIVHLT